MTDELGALVVGGEKYDRKANIAIGLNFFDYGLILTGLLMKNNRHEIDTLGRVLI